METAWSYTYFPTRYLQDAHSIVGTPYALRSAGGSADGRECGGLRGAQFRAMEATARNLIVGTPSSLQSAEISVELSDVCYREPHLPGHCWGSCYTLNVFTGTNARWAAVLLGLLGLLSLRSCGDSTTRLIFGLLPHPYTR